MRRGLHQARDGDVVEVRHIAKGDAEQAVNKLVEPVKRDERHYADFNDAVEVFDHLARCLRKQRMEDDERHGKQKVIVQNASERIAYDRVEQILEHAVYLADEKREHGKIKYEKNDSRFFLAGCQGHLACFRSCHSGNSFLYLSFCLSS
ncbi:hypothetical protein SDC9_134187 [bioreactor metagenome]|uniref:Uncharacterized protein n=1 Tax=bioreactor metagenome TaxID=1076179 RepID=A0A645DCH8_9ZZZZ